MNATGALALGRWNGSMPPLGHYHTRIGQLFTLGDAWILPIIHAVEAVVTSLRFYCRQRPAVATGRLLSRRARLDSHHFTNHSVLRSPGWVKQNKAVDHDPFKTVQST